MAQIAAGQLPGEQHPQQAGQATPGSSRGQGSGAPCLLLHPCLAPHLDVVAAVADGGAHVGQHVQPVLHDQRQALDRDAQLVRVVCGAGGGERRARRRRCSGARVRCRAGRGHVRRPGLARMPMQEERTPPPPRPPHNHPELAPAPKHPVAAHHARSNHAPEQCSARRRRGLVAPPSRQPAGCLHPPPPLPLPSPQERRRHPPESLSSSWIRCRWSRRNWRIL
jgi:hypothetical protein